MERFLHGTIFNFLAGHPLCALNEWKFTVAKLLVQNFQKFVCMDFL